MHASRFATPLSSLQHRLVMGAVFLVMLGAFAHHGPEAWLVAAGAAAVGIAAHAGLAGGLLLVLAAGLGWITRVSRFADVTRLLDEVRWRGDETVLDLGCGDGLVAIRAAERLRPSATNGAKVIAIDDWARPHGTRPIDPTQCAANVRAAGFTERVTIETAPFDRLPLSDASVDVAVAVFSLHHLPSEIRERALSELARVVRPGGRVLLAEPRHREAMAATLRARGLRAVLGGRTFPRFLFGWVLAERPVDAATTAAQSLG